MPLAEPTIPRMITYFENSYVLMTNLGLIFTIIALDLIANLFAAESEVRIRLLFGIVLVQIGDAEEVSAIQDSQDKSWPARSTRRYLALLSLSASLQVSQLI